jgi:VWFA-related protein
MTQRFRFILLTLILISGVMVRPVIAQVKTQKSQQEPDEVVRVKTELVQTDLIVLDKRGKFVSGLNENDFELSVDGKLQPLSFFEEVAAGSVNEERQLTAARKGGAAVQESGAPTSATGRGRTIFFFVDDIHLTNEGLARARSVLTNFVENKMGPADRVAVVSTSGQIGFLQQLTDNKAVLHEAISRLNYKYNPEATASHVTITEADANVVANHADRGLFAYLIEATAKEFQTTALNAYNIVVNRIRQINAQSRVAEVDTLSRLESLMRSTAPLMGRKVLFFISDGFIVDPKRSNGAEVMRRVTQQAARTGVVVYSLDTRTNSLEASIDVSRNDYPDFSPRTAGRSIVESKMPQEPLETLADETGGRAYLNPNGLNEGVAEALAESSAYYLLAWRPVSEKQRNGKSRLKVVVKDRPDLQVRMRRRFFDFRENQTTGAAKSDANAAANNADLELKLALGSLYPRRDLPTSVSASLVNAEKGTVLNVSMQIDGTILTFDESNAKPQATVDVLGMAIDDRGQFSSFKQKLDIPREVVIAKDGRFIKWNQALPLPPGLYQVRVAVRDRQSGRTGSAMTWIEIESH